MTKVGKHEEALAKMMSETDRDFFFFNKLKKEKTEKGQWEFKKPVLNPYEFMEKGSEQNRFKKAFNKSYLSVAKPESSGDYKARQKESTSHDLHKGHKTKRTIINIYSARRLK